MRPLCVLCALFILSSCSLFPFKTDEDDPAPTITGIAIGGQVWSSENASVVKFANGDVIPEVKSTEDWKQAGKNKMPAMCNARNKSHGKLYNWYAISDPRGFAPEGWRIATDYEWEKIIKTLGGYAEAGDALKSKSADWKDTNATNSSNFSGVPTEERNSDGLFVSLGTGPHTRWWSFTVSAGDPPTAWTHSISAGTKKVERFAYKYEWGFPVRFVKNP